MRAATVLLIGSLLFLSGCIQQSQVPGTLDLTSGPLLDKLHHLYPDRFRMYHHVILTLRGKNYDFNGYLTREGDHISAVGFNDLGGRLFDINSSPQKVELPAKPRRMPATILRNYVAPELNAVFAPTLQTRPSHGADDKIVLVDGRRNLEYDFDQALEHCDTITIREGNDTITVIQLRNYMMYAGWDREIPQTIIVLNRRWNYQMTLRLLQIKSP